MKQDKNIIWEFQDEEIIDIPDQNVIKCEIETPQFHGHQNKFHMYKQSGTFYKSDMKFIHDGLTGHDVHFHNINDFQKSLIRLSCSCDNGIIVCPGCGGEESKFGICAGCKGTGVRTCGKCGGKKIRSDKTDILNKLLRWIKSEIKWFLDDIIYETSLPKGQRNKKY